jgi:YbbR domain-containing protein
MTDRSTSGRRDEFWGDVVFWVLRDWPWKTVALVLATILYLFIRARIRNVETVVVPLDIDPQAQVTAATIEPLAVSVTIQGSLAELQRLDSRNLRMLVRPSFSEGRAVTPSWFSRLLRSAAGNRSRVRGNTEEFRLSARNLQGVNRQMRVIKIDPRTAKVTYDVRVEVELPVAEPVVVGKPYRGRVVIDYPPKTVRVTGSRDQLEEMVASGVQLQTGPVDVDGRVQGYRKTVPILQPSVSRLVKLEPAEVTAEVKIITDRFTSVFSNVTVLVKGLPGEGLGWTCAPTEVSVKLTGRAEVVNAIQPDQVSVFVDRREAQRLGTNVLPVKVFLPYELSVETAETEPSTVTVSPVAPDADAGAGAGPEDAAKGLEG